jgi:hypothetical protein
MPLNPDPAQPLASDKAGRGGGGRHACSHAEAIPRVESERVPSPRRRPSAGLPAVEFPVLRQRQHVDHSAGSVALSDKTYLPGWACELMALADQHDARYLHFEADGPLVGSLRVYD